MKFCGCICAEDALLAVDCGADAVGMIFADSPRRIAFRDAERIVAALPPSVVPVGVFVDPSLAEIRRARAIFPHLAIQLHGGESSGFVAEVGGTTIKALHVDPAHADEAALERAADSYSDALLLFDSKIEGLAGGSGVAFSWHAIAAIARRRRVIVAGGLTPENVGACVRVVRPYGVDVRGGVETGGRKDEAKMRSFVRSVREADAT